MPTIFISYRRNDSGGHAGRIHDRLRQWFPVDELFIDVNSIGWGQDFPKELDDAVRMAKAILVLIGPDWGPSLNCRASSPHVDFVRREISISLQRWKTDEVAILPILVGGAKMPSIDDLDRGVADDIGKLLDIQGREFPMDVTSWDFQFKRLLRCLSGIEGIPAPTAQVAEGPNLLAVPFSESERDANEEPFDAQTVEQSFESVSRTLLNWPQETDGQWIVRPELDQLYELATQNDSALIALLGGPGEGKSAILARLGTRLSEEGIVLLAIKADRVPRATASLRDLDNWIGCDVPVTRALLELARSRRVIVLIDQLDALAELMDQHTERLDSLLRFIDSICDCENLSVLVSCREFEFRNDVRFKTLNAQEVSLDRLSWSKVEPLLEERSLNTTTWSDEVRNVLRTPQHLSLFLDHLATCGDAPLFTNYQGLLSRVIRDRIEKPHGVQTVLAAEYIASDMAAAEELWLSRDRFTREFSEELQRLEESGFLVRSENELSIAFRHQTLFDFLRARVFLRGQQSLVDYVIDKKTQSLFVRPILWSTLNYLRESDTAVYRKQFEELWAHPDLRRHLRFLLIDFLGQQRTPDDREARWLFSLIDTTEYADRVLRAAAGSPGWFERLESRLPELMTAGPEKAWKVTPVLRRAAAFARARVLAAVSAHWLLDERYQACAFSVLRDLETWDDESVDIACKLADHAPNEVHTIQILAKQISQSGCKLAPKVVVRYLQAKLKKIDARVRKAASHQVASDSRKPQGADLYSSQFPAREYGRLIDHDTDWYGIEEIARSAPREFTVEIWPWLIELFTRMSRPVTTAQIRYRSHHGLAFKHALGKQQPLQQAIEIAVSCFADADPNEFLKFVRKHEDTELEVLHFLFALGLEKISEHRPEEVLEYLLQDRRRFSIGDMENELRYSRRLISSIAPLLDPSQASRLESAILAWTPHPSIRTGQDAKDRMAVRNWNRQKRLRLIRAFPFGRLSKRAQKYMKEEERAFPDAIDVDRHFSGGLIKSPMSAEQMGKATNEEIIGLFEELTDDTGGHHPRRRYTELLGGSDQASLEFAKFASKAPKRALELIRQFQSGKTEKPVGAALVELVKNSTPAEELLACIHELNGRGFSSEHFRLGAARCLFELAPRLKGLDDHTCSLLESWIADWRPEAVAGTSHIQQGTLQNSGIERTESDDDKWGSFLWGMGHFRVIPDGNYPLLNALMHGLLCRRPTELNSWLAVLERHLTRNENPEVWCEIATDLWRLVKAERSSAAGFLELLFSSYPQVLLNATGVRLVANVQSWIPDGLRAEITENWISGEWQKGPQAAGEVLALHLCRNPEDAETESQVEQILQGETFGPTVTENLRLGMAHTFAQAWTQPAFRAFATPYLLALASMESRAVDFALSGVFNKMDSLPTDGHTEQILKAMLDRPAIFTGARHSLISQLKGLLHDGWNPVLVYRVTEKIIAERERELGDIRTAWAASSGDLADIALTLHRFSETKQEGLELFEHLIIADSYGMDKRIAQIDRPAFR